MLLKKRNTSKCEITYKCWRRSQIHVYCNVKYKSQIQNKYEIQELVKSQIHQNMKNNTNARKKRNRTKCEIQY